MIGSTNLSIGGGVGSDELTATAANVLEETTYVGADTDDELAEGTMQHLTNRATITHTAENATKVIEGDAAFTSINSDGTARAEIRYNGTEGFITPNTLFAVPQGDMATAGGLTAEKLLEGQSAFGIAGAATSDATAIANQISSGKIAYVKGSKITGTLAERGQAQFGRFGQGNGYVAINALPEGIYRSNGAAWAPEARIATSTLASEIGLNASVIKKGVSILGITGSYEGYYSGNGTIYNRGSWGSGYNIGWFTSYVQSFDNSGGVSITQQQTSIAITTKNKYKQSTEAVDIGKKELIVGNPWNNLTVIMFSNRNVDCTLEAKIYNSSGSIIAQSDQVADGTEKTISINLSNINTSFYIRLENKYVISSSYWYSEDFTILKIQLS